MPADPEGPGTTGVESPGGLIGPGTGSGLTPVWRRLLNDSLMLLQHAQENGIKLPPAVVEQLEAAVTAAEKKEPVSTRQLQAIYNTLLDRLAPATPQSIAVTAPGLKLKTLYRRRWMVYAMLSAAGLSLVGYLWTLSALSQTSDAAISTSLVLHLLCAAGLGASFNALFIAYRYLVQRTFDPKYNMTYLIRFALGLIAGVVLAGLIDPKEAVQAENSILRQLSPGLVALLGGYAAEAVQLILTRIVEMLVTLVQGGAEAQVQAQGERLKAEQEGERVRQRLAVVRSIAAAAQDLGPGGDTAELQKKLEELQLSILEEEPG